MSVPHQIREWSGGGARSPRLQSAGRWMLETSHGSFALIHHRSGGSRQSSRWSVVFGIYGEGSERERRYRSLLLNQWIRYHELSQVAARTRRELIEILCQTIQLHPPTPERLQRQFGEAAILELS